MSVNPPRQANRLTYTILVCPHSGKEECGHPQHERVPLEVVAKARIAEVEQGRDDVARQLQAFRERGCVPFQIGEVTLFGTSQNANKARWTVEHLKGKGA